VLLTSNQQSEVFKNQGITADVLLPAQAGAPALAYLSGIRTMTLPPGTPDYIQAYWNDALQKVVKDADLQAVAKKTGTPMVYMSVETTLKEAQGIRDLYEKYRSMLLKYYE
jgi:tripartite-type tricarboxylate transporter receptor subunit TctC